MRHGDVQLLVHDPVEVGGAHLLLGPGEGPVEAGCRVGHPGEEGVRVLDRKRLHLVQHETLADIALRVCGEPPSLNVTPAIERLLVDVVVGLHQLPDALLGAEEPRRWGVGLLNATSVLRDHSALVGIGASEDEVVRRVDVHGLNSLQEGAVIGDVLEKLTDQPREVLASCLRCQEVERDVVGRDARVGVDAPAGVRPVLEAQASVDAQAAAGHAQEGSDRLPRSREDAVEPVVRSVDLGREVLPLLVRGHNVVVHVPPVDDRAVAHGHQEPRAAEGRRLHGMPHVRDDQALQSHLRVIDVPHDALVLSHVHIADGRRIHPAGHHLLPNADLVGLACAGGLGDDALPVPPGEVAPTLRGWKVEVDNLGGHLGHGRAGHQEQDGHWQHGVGFGIGSAVEDAGWGLALCSPSGVKLQA
mmetsp:Transcript_11944/g.27286  ORF Transcript_11944/g.27286 Transcript_11944/m.27286 type:complete len:416 (-) Transcript_11944:17-1264(-)